MAHGMFLLHIKCLFKCFLGHNLPKRRQCLAFVSLLIFFINLLWSSFIIFLWSYISGKRLFLFFFFFLNRLVFVTTYMQVCSTIKCQIDGSLVKVYFSESVGSKCWMLNFTLIFFGLLPKRLCWGQCWWWFTRNIWPKARVACIFCYVWTHL